MDSKVIIVFIVCALGVPFIGMGFESWAKNDCVKAYAMSTRTADEIKTICKL